MPVILSNSCKWHEEIAGYDNYRGARKRTSVFFSIPALMLEWGGMLQSEFSTSVFTYNTACYMYIQCITDQRNIINRVSTMKRKK